jgi:hypothetical protein
MRMKTILAALALTTAATSIPLAAQPGPGWQAGSTWNREAFWRGAPENMAQRIDWLQRRIDRGVADRTLSRQEARRAQLELDRLRRDAAVLDQRLDQLGQNLRWERRDNQYGYDGDRGYREPYSTDYDAARYYRDDRRYAERRLAPDEEVFRGSDGRYYCKRNDGTTGLIIGGAGGALLGNVIDGGRNRAAGTLIGGALGALLGRSIDQNNSDVRCR